MYTKRLQSTGEFALTLRPETPQTVKDAIVEWGHIILTNVRVKVSDIELGTLGTASNGLLPLSVFTGIVTNIDQADDGSMEITGPHITAHLGDGDIGPTSLSDITFASVTNATTVVNSLLPAAIKIGSIGPMSGTWSGRHVYETPLSGLSRAMELGFSSSWRVNDDGTFDAAPLATLFVNTPTAVFVKNAGGTDPRLSAGRIETARLSRDARDLITYARVLGEQYGGGVYAGQFTGSHSYTDLWGNPLVRRLITSDTAVETVFLGNAAQSLVNESLTPRRDVEITLDDEFTVEGEYEAGDNIYLFDQQAGFYDTSTQVLFRGEPIFPETVRLLGVTRPIHYQMGVWYRAASGAYTDLTPYFVPEVESASVEIGKLPEPTLGTEDIQTEIVRIKNLFDRNGDLLWDNNGTVVMRNGTDFEWPYSGSTANFRMGVGTGDNFGIVEESTAGTDANRFVIQDGPQGGDIYFGNGPADGGYVVGRWNKTGMVLNDGDAAARTPHLTYDDIAGFITLSTTSAWVTYPGSNHTVTLRTTGTKVWVEGHFTTNPNPTAGTVSSIRMRMQISIDGGSSWTTGETVREDQRYDVFHFSGMCVATGTCTGDIVARLQVWSASTNVNWSGTHAVYRIDGKL